MEGARGHVYGSVGRSKPTGLWRHGFLFDAYLTKGMRLKGFSGVPQVRKSQVPAIGAIGCWAAAVLRAGRGGRWWAAGQRDGEVCVYGSVGKDTPASRWRHGFLFNALCSCVRE